MLLRPAFRSLSQQRRSFVSSVLLSRPWNKLSITDLKKEARTRGLSPTGNKTAIIKRIQEHEKSLSSSAVVSQEVIRASIEEVPVDAKEGETPGIPLTSQSTAPAPDFFNVVLPDAAYETPEAPVQIPYAFDFWESSSSNTAVPVADENTLPKMVVVGGAETHRDGGPSHKLLDDYSPSLPPLVENEASTSSSNSSSTPPGKGGLWDDIVEDLGLPPRAELKKSFFKLFA